MSFPLLNTPLRLVFVDGSTPIVMRPAVQPISLPQYAAGHIPVEAYNSDGSVHDLSGDTVLLGVRLHPTDSTPAIELQLTFDDYDEAHEGRFELIPGHWTSVPPRIYGYSVVAYVYGEAEDAAVVAPHSQWKTTPANVHPGDDISVPESQQPLAQGPQGEQGEDGDPGPGILLTTLATRPTAAAAYAAGTLFAYLTDAGRLTFTDGTDWYSVTLEPEE